MSKEEERACQYTGYCKNESYSDFLNGYLQAEKDLQSMSFQPTPFKDLEEAANNALSNVLNTHEIVNVRSCLEMFRLGAEWQKQKDDDMLTIAYMDGVEEGKTLMKQQIVDKACKYLQEHKEDVETEDNGIVGWISDEFIEKFRKGLEE